jgi:hypothetical protein
LAANRTTGEVLAGPAREGLCLLQGLLICGICGRRLAARYTGNGGLYPVYNCNWKHREALARRDCLAVSAKPLDTAVAERVVVAVTPLTIALALMRTPHMRCLFVRPALCSQLPSDLISR